MTVICQPEYSYDTTISKWVPIWGDGKVVDTEKCDDGNINDGDGWKGDCTSVEAGWVWSGGTSTTKDACTFCTSGLYQNDATTPTTCVPHCGGGFRAGIEKCDDGNTLDGDWWKGDCSAIEVNWVWRGGTPTSKDMCIHWGYGWKQNSIENPDDWVKEWGDKFRVGNESCDDGNIIDGDGWSSLC